MLTKDQILAALDRKTEYVAITGLNDMVGLRAMSGLERDRYLDLVRGKETGVSYFNAALITFTAVDGDGNTLFTPDDIDGLMRLPATLLGDLADAAARANGMGPKEPAAPAAVQATA
ncbi:hypothetical protein NE850_11605 [Paraburkholderia sp. USG1]|uniref:hypothetical protein n=1 Tax=Paraburkholderia sp. USG1 TaxID=2952268 RepID=UPI002862CC6D|nr:hypothetical protein [Paraburkholderia sp. USG1]MDR8396985.1 hypothetical protein [Paraburkholderia sp. USG1]